MSLVAFLKCIEKNTNRTHPSPWQDNAYFKDLVWNNKSEDQACFLLDVIFFR